MKPTVAALVFCTTNFLTPGACFRQAVSDDLTNEKVMRVLERLATDGRDRPLPVGKLFQTNEKNQIVELKLRQAKLQPDDLQVLAELEQLEKLDLSRSNVTDAQLRFVGSFGSLKELNLYSTAVSGKGIAHLQMMVQLEYLELGRTKLDNDSLKPCKSMKNLSRLGLRGTEVYGEGLRSVQELKRIHCIDLGDTPAADDTISFLSRMTSLKTVLLDQTKVTSKGVSKLGENPRLFWIDSAEETVKEWVRRIRKKDYVSASLLNPVGLEIPQSGEFSKPSITPRKRDVKDMIHHRHRFRVQFFWEVDGRKPTTLFYELAVDRGAVKIMEMGIAE